MYLLWMCESSRRAVAGADTVSCTHACCPDINRPLPQAVLTCDLMWNDTDIPLAFLITFRCYGTWLHGDDRGSVNQFRRASRRGRVEMSEVGVALKKKKVMGRS